MSDMSEGRAASVGHTWFGLLSGDVREAHAIIEASKLGLLQRVTRRLTDEERIKYVRPGAVFVWEEEEAGIRRWTDAIRWSPSRVSGVFLTYQEMPTRGDDTLIKQSFFSVDSSGTKMHLIAYTTKRHRAEASLPAAADDPILQPFMQRYGSSSSTKKSNATSSASSSSSRPISADSGLRWQAPPPPPPPLPHPPPPPSRPIALHRHPSSPHLTDPGGALEELQVPPDIRPRPRTSSSAEVGGQLHWPGAHRTSPDAPSDHVHGPLERYPSALPFEPLPPPPFSLRPRPATASSLASSSSAPYPWADLDRRRSAEPTWHPASHGEGTVPPVPLVRGREDERQLRLLMRGHDHESKE